MLQSRILLIAIVLSIIISIPLLWYFNMFYNKQYAINSLPQEISASLQPRILAFGDSLTAGLGVDIREAYPALLEEKLNKNGYEWKVINAGISGETTAGGVRRASFVAERTKPDIIILALGANDALRALPTKEVERNLNSILDAFQSSAPSAKIILAGMRAPRNLGVTYTNQFDEIYPRIAQERNIPLIPFLLEGVALVPELNLSDGIHPNPEGHRRIAQMIFPYVEREVKLLSIPREE
jgi:acyl-CoA thioesterase-1